MDIGTVPLSKIEAITAKLHRDLSDKSSEEIHLSFEFLVGSCFPDIITNIKESLSDAQRMGYIQGFQDGQNLKNSEI